MKKKIIIFGSLGIALLLGLIAVKILLPSRDEYNFKKEYEEYNGKWLVTGERYHDVEIDTHNRADYIDMSDANEILENGTGLLYIGMKTDYNSRFLVEPLVAAVKKADLSEFSYVDVLGIREQYTVENGKLVPIIEEKNDDYDKLLELLGDYLEEYVYRDAKGTDYETGTVRLEIPLIVGVRKGTIVGVIKSEDIMSSNGLPLEDSVIEKKVSDLIDSVKGIDNSGVCEEEC